MGGEGYNRRVDLKKKLNIRQKSGYETYYVRLYRHKHEACLSQIETSPETVDSIHGRTRIYENVKSLKNGKNRCPIHENVVG